MLDLHRHDQDSTFDGFGNAEELAKLAKELGHTALSITNHGTTSSLVRHYFACKENDIKPVLGVEIYFLPILKEQTRGTHLCLYAKDLDGYKNINKIQSKAEEQKYYSPIATFKELEKWNKGIICSTACLGSIFSKAIQNKNIKMLDKLIKKFKNIFGKDFYIEIQPYKVDEDKLQEKVNEELIKASFRHNVKCILTSDSHMGRKEDLDTYIKMHEIKGRDIEQIVKGYGERYMPTEKELMIRFYKMHKNSKVLKHKGISPKTFAKQCIKNAEEIENKVNGNILDELKPGLPVFDKSKDSKKLLKQWVKNGLQEKGKWNEEYKIRAKEELDVIFYHKFEDYFLMVADYIHFAKNENIAVGPGRGSGCNSLVNFALDITGVDPIIFKLNFSRFLRYDKGKLPDIDIDFEKDRRNEVINYLLDKYKDQSAQICSYGKYQIDILMNDLAKVCDIENHVRQEIKAFIRSFIDDENLDKEALLKDEQSKFYNDVYDNVIVHFVKMYKKIRYIGTHAAGVAIVSGNIREFVATKIDKDTNRLSTVYDLNDLDKLNVTKFDILGLVTMSSLKEARTITGNKGFNDNWINDKKLISAFYEGKTDGIFQFSRNAVKNIFNEIQADSFNDIIAVNALNRPGPLSLQLPSLYANNKINDAVDKSTSYYEYVKETYGTIIYQEQIQEICVNIGEMKWSEADKVMKMNRGATEKTHQMFEEFYTIYMDKFIKGAANHNLEEEQARSLFDTFFNYSFNKGHAVGYCIVALEEMYYKIYHPTVFWYTKIKYANNEADRIKFQIQASKDGAIIFLPHVNYTEKTSLKIIDNEQVIQLGLDTIKGVGEKAANFIFNEKNENGIFRNYDEFEKRCKNRAVTSKVRSLLLNEGAVEFNKKRYESRVIKYNSSLLAK